MRRLLIIFLLLHLQTLNLSSPNSEVIIKSRRGKYPRLELWTRIWSYVENLNKDNVEVENVLKLYRLSSNQISSIKSQFPQFFQFNPFKILCVVRFVNNSMTYIDYTDFTSLLTKSPHFIGLDLVTTIAVRHAYAHFYNISKSKSILDPHSAHNNCWFVSWLLYMYGWCFQSKIFRHTPK